MVLTRSDVHPQTVKVMVTTNGRQGDNGGMEARRHRGDGDAVRRPLEQGLSAGDWLSVSRCWN